MKSGKYVAIFLLFTLFFDIVIVVECCCDKTTRKWDDLYQSVSEIAFYCLFAFDISQLGDYLTHFY